MLPVPNLCSSHSVTTCEVVETCYWYSKECNEEEEKGDKGGGVGEEIDLQGMEEEEDTGGEGWGRKLTCRGWFCVAVERMSWNSLLLSSCVAHRLCQNAKLFAKD